MIRSARCSGREDHPDHSYLAASQGGHREGDLRRVRGRRKLLRTSHRHVRTERLGRLCDAAGSRRIPRPGGEPFRFEGTLTGNVKGSMVFPTFTWPTSGQVSEDDVTMAAMNVSCDLRR
jgi:hypothetical protein